MDKNTTPTGKNSAVKKLPKQWIIAANRPGHISQKADNGMLELIYKETLAAVKKLNTYPIVYFEKDHRQDNAHDAFVMHTYLSPTFYFQLECAITCSYFIEYAFNSCPHEEEIRKLLRRWPLEIKAKEVKLQPDYQTFYRAVLNFQDKKYHHSL